MTTFSVIVPARNEERDLARTLDALLAQVRASYEVIVVDDGSTDGTGEIVRSRTEDVRVRVLETAGGVGAATARNLGIDSAGGDVVVFVDADVVLPPDFLSRLEELYAAGAECVSVESRVPSAQTAISRFQQATHEEDAGRLVGFSQAFSCTRERASTTRFPDTMPGCGGEDGAFFERLVKAGCRHLLAPELVVQHYVPDRLGGLVRQAAGRGVASAYVDRRLRSLSAPVTAARRAAAGARDILWGVSVVLPVASAVRRSHFSPRGSRDVVAFAVLFAVVTVARGVGKWRGALRVLSEKQ